MINDSSKPLRIVHITPEVAPVAKVGGLADVVPGLSATHQKRGDQLEIIIPAYDVLKTEEIKDYQEKTGTISVHWGDKTIDCTIARGMVHHVACTFLKPHSEERIFDRGKIYGEPDDAERFALFSLAALEYLEQQQGWPDIIHAHDWQTGFVPILYKKRMVPPDQQKTRICYTIHNFKHQGICGAHLLEDVKLLPVEHYMRPHLAQDRTHPYLLNSMKMGFAYSDFITTVSAKHAWEVKDDGQGFGMEPMLHRHHYKYGGVLNGIDTEVWNPATDAHLDKHYDSDRIEQKYANKSALRKACGLRESDAPVVAFVGRLDPQKGLEQIEHALFYTLYKGGQFVLLGSSPDQEINMQYHEIKRQLEGSPDCHLELGYNEALGHLVYAGADLMIMPSRFEPCGLTQLIAMRYGTIPVVRAVGGLADTVFDKDFSDRPKAKRNGYVFDHGDVHAIESTLERAFTCFSEYPDAFRELIYNAMLADYSWNEPATHYRNIYEHILRHGPSDPE